MHVSNDPSTSVAPGNLSRAPFGPEEEVNTALDAPGQAAELARIKAEVRPICQSVSLLTDEMVRMAGGTVPDPRDSRRRKCHVRQIAMYVCHVALGMTLTNIGLGFGRDRSTVAYACGVVEDRRDGRAYDEFVSSIERVVTSIYKARGEAGRDE